MAKLSIVIPVYYNAENLPPLYADIKEKILAAEAVAGGVEGLAAGCENAGAEKQGAQGGQSKNAGKGFHMNSSCRDWFAQIG